jgi:serine protease Do
MKKISTVILVFMLVFANIPSVVAVTPIKVLIDGKLQSYKQAPVMKNDSVYVPMRAIFESLGARIEWDSQTESVSAFKDSKIIVLTIGNQVAFLNGTPITLAGKPFTVNGNTMIPLRFVSESLGAKVGWESNSRTVLITTNTNTTSVPASSGSTSENSDKLTVKEIVEQNDAKVVTIYTANLAGPLSLGSGVVIADQFILTNYHVMNGATSGYIQTVSGDSYEIEGITIYSTAWDLAIIKTKKSLGVTPIKLGDNANTSKGDHVVAIGSPEGLQNTVSEGVVSNKLILQGVQVLQISVPITHGSSGGALFNDKGEVIGITTSGLDTNADLNFAVSINHVYEWLGKLNKDQVATWPLNDPKSQQLDRFDQMLNQSFKTIPTAKHNFSLGEYWIHPPEKEGDFIWAYSVMSYEEYTWYVNHYDTIKDELMAWTKSLAEKVDELYPNDPVLVEIYFYKSYDYDPSAYYAKEDITYDPNRKVWDVWHRIIYVNLSDKVYYGINF